MCCRDLVRIVKTKTILGISLSYVYFILYKYEVSFSQIYIHKYPNIHVSIIYIWPEIEAKA